MSTLDYDQAIRLLQAANRLRDALSTLQEAIGIVPVVGDAELHTMSLDLKRLASRLHTHADNAEEIAREAANARS